MDPLTDPCNDRKLKEVIPPPHLCLEHSLLYPRSGTALSDSSPIGGRDKDKPDWKLLRDHLHKEGRLTRDDCVKIITDTTNVFSRTPPGLSQKNNLIFSICMTPSLWSATSTASSTTWSKCWRWGASPNLSNTSSSATTSTEAAFR